MSWAYFDTSPLIKRYVDEAGRRAVLQLLRRHQCVTSAVLPVEFRRALRRRATDGSLDARRIPQIVKRFAADREFWALIEPTGDVLQAAEKLAAAHPLRTLDAIHVASAELFGERLQASELTFVSADARQIAVAAALGMTTETFVRDHGWLSHTGRAGPSSAGRGAFGRTCRTRGQKVSGDAAPLSPMRRTAHAPAAPLLPHRT